VCACVRVRERKREGKKDRNGQYVPGCMYMSVFICLSVRLCVCASVCRYVCVP